MHIIFYLTKNYYSNCIKHTKTPTIRSQLDISESVLNVISTFTTFYWWRCFCA